MLTSRDVGEGDCIYTFYGKRKGKFRAVARGIRRLTSRRRGHLGTFNICRVLCAEGKSLDVLSEAEGEVVIDPTEFSSHELEAIGLVAMVLNKLTPEEDADTVLYENCREYLVGKHSDDETVETVCSMLIRMGFLSLEQKLKLTENSEKNLVILRRYVEKILDNA